jgi:hypothetical protein
MSRRIRIACPAAFYPLPQVKALAGSHGAAARVAAVERAPAALKVLCCNLEKLGLTAGLLADGAVVIAEHRRKEPWRTAMARSNAPESSNRAMRR